MTFKSAVAALACMAVVPISALAQGNPQEPLEEEVVVRAGAVEEAVRAFVGAVTVEAGRTDQIAVWGGRLCIGVMGLRGLQAQAIIDRIATHADALGVNVGEPGCSPNLLIIVTTDSDAVARNLVAEYRRVLGYNVTDGATRGRTALADFAETPRAVRWWHVSNAADESGAVAVNRTIGGPPAVTTSAGGSRIENATHQTFTRAFIVVDSLRVAGMRIDALSDYISMAALAQLDPEADTSAYPTILNAFRNGAATGEALELTDWDLAYLEGLYDAPANRNAGFQRRAIQRSVARGGN